MPDFSRPDTPPLALCSAQLNRKSKAEEIQARSSRACPARLLRPPRLLRLSLSVFFFFFCTLFWTPCVVCHRPSPHAQGQKTCTNNSQTQNKTRSHAPQPRVPQPANPSGSLAQTVSHWLLFPASHQHRRLFSSPLHPPFGPQQEHRRQPRLLNIPQRLATTPKTLASSPVAGRFLDTTP